MFSFCRRHPIVSVLVAIPLLLILYLGYRSRGPHRSYRADLVKPAPGVAITPAALQVGVAEVNITPDLSIYEPWVDSNNDSKFNPKDGDTYTDKNGNGKFDSVWIAGFSNNRPPKGVHDPLLAQAIAFRNNDTTLVMVTIDSIGILHEKFIDVRKSIDPSLGIDHVMFSSTHNHEAPDTLGIWSNTNNPLTQNNFDYGYMAFLKGQLKLAVEDAVKALQPAEMTLAEVTVGPDGFMDDSRLPHVYDNFVRSARFTKPGTDETIATVVEWGNHVETLASKNSELTADFVHYLRKGVEDGVGEPNGAEALGGMCLYFQGLVGGLMTQLHTVVPHRDGVQKFDEGTYEKAQALGENVAIEVIKSQRGPTAFKSATSNVAIAAKTIFVPLDGLFEYASFLGLLHPGWYWGKGKTEVNAFRIGDLEVLTIPGELYPEIAYGGIEKPDGADFGIDPVEIPPLHPQMKGKLNMMIGLANDEIGYIIPKSQWDVEAPYAYGRTDDPQYGEENSGGPDVGPVIHKECMAILATLHEAVEAK